MTYPYSDNNMRYDYSSHRYVLTSDGVRSLLAINIETEFRTDIANSKEAFLNLVSLQTYNIIHNYSVDNSMQDYVISKTESGRKMICEAMCQRLLFLVTREDMYAESFNSIINRSLPEIGCTITYAGCLRFCSDDKTEW